MNAKKYFIFTFGCQMNKNDSERLAGVLLDLGYQESSEPKSADLLFINTCSVRQHAEDRVFGIINEWQKFRKNKPNLIIGVTGCMPGRDKDGKIIKKLKGVDLFFPIGELTLLPERLNQINGDLTGRAAAGHHSIDDYLSINPLRKNNFTAFVTIQNGCNNLCTYCVVPYSRGREKNRPVKEILEEIKVFAKNGGVEVVLLGQVVNNFQFSIFNFQYLNKDNPFKKHDCFSALLWEINQMPGIKRIFFTAADPQYFNEFQIEALKLPKVVNYLHLPVQSGDNEILKKMNRKYTREQYIELVENIRKAKPEISIGTDIIVGFCGETEEQFQNTVDLYEQCDFDISFHAKYSQRTGTLAAKLYKDDISKVEKQRRWRILQAMMEKITLRKNQKYLNKTVSVLVDSIVKDGLLSGNSSEMKMVRFKGDKSLVGKIVRVKIDKAKEWVLFGNSES